MIDGSHIPADATLRFDGGVIEAILAYDRAHQPRLADAIEAASSEPDALAAVLALLADHGIACEALHQPGVRLPLIVLAGGRVPEVVFFASSSPTDTSHARRRAARRAARREARAARRRGRR